MEEIVFGWKDNRDIRDKGYRGPLIEKCNVVGIAVTEKEAAQTMFNIITDDIENAKKKYLDVA